MLVSVCVCFRVQDTDAVNILLQVNVNVAAKGDVDFFLVYEELLSRKFGRYEHVSYFGSRLRGRHARAPGPAPRGAR